MDLESLFEGSAVPEILAPRHVLLNAFHRAAARRLVLVSAPAGSGKTVSTMLWLKDSDRVPIVLRMNERLNWPGAFYRELCSRVAKASLQDGRAAFLDDPGFYSAPIEYTKRLFGLLEDDGNLYALIIDDAHLLTDEECGKSFPELLTLLPHNYTGLILSRQEPPNQFAALEAKKRAVRINGSDLAFTKDEIAGYFRQCDKVLTDEQAAAAYTLTGGWPMGVNALLLSGSMSFGQKPGKLDAYLHENVWNSWEAQHREFLMKTSIAEDLTPELCDRLTDRSDSEAYLYTLHRSNAFLNRTEEGRYSYHHLFRDFLARKRAEEGVDEKALYKTASRYYSERGMEYDALRCACLGDDEEGIAAGMAMIYRFSLTSNSVAYHAQMLKNYLPDLMPAAATGKNPYILINYIWYHYLMNDVPAMLSAADSFYANMEVFLKQNAAFIDLGKMISTLDFRKPISGIAPDIDIATPSASTLQTATITENMVFFHRGNRDYTVALPDFEKEFAACEKAFAHILGPVTDIIVDVIVAGVYYELDRLDESRELAERSLAALPEDMAGELVVGPHILSAVLSRADGDEGQFKKMLAYTKERMKTDRSEHLLPNILALEYRFLLMDANKKAAEEWLRFYFVTEPAKPEFYKYNQHLTTVRALLVLNELDRAEVLLTQLHRMAHDYVRPLDVTETGILLAALLYNSKRKKEGREKFYEILRYAQGYGFIRLFADDGASVAVMLEEISYNADSFAGLDRAYFERVLRLARDDAKIRHGVAWNINAKPVTLPNQQKRILKMIEEGKKQTAIAAELNLALPTVKAHISVIHKKLGVRKSKDAIVKAKELGLMQ